MILVIALCTYKIGMMMTPKVEFEFVRALAGPP